MFSSVMRGHLPCLWVSMEADWEVPNLEPARSFKQGRDMIKFTVYKNLLDGVEDVVEGANIFPESLWEAMLSIMNGLLPYVVA